MEGARTGPIGEDVTRELEALKQKLAAMSADELPDAQARILVQEIGAIRLQLKRLAADRQVLQAGPPS